MHMLTVFAVQGVSVHVHTNVCAYMHIVCAYMHIRRIYIYIYIYIYMGNYGRAETALVETE